MFFLNNSQVCVQFVLWDWSFNIDEQNMQYEEQNLQLLSNNNVKLTQKK